MPHKTPYDFLDEDYDTVYHNIKKDLKIEKLSTRVTLLSILLPCLFGIVVFIAYLDIKDRVIQTKETESTGIRELAKNIESGFTSLSIKQAKLEDAVKARMDRIEKDAEVLRRTMGSKADKEATAKAISRLEKDLKGAKAALESADARYDKIKEAVESIKAEVLRLAETVKADAKRRKKETEALKKRVDALEQAFKEAEEKIAATGKSLEKQLKETKRALSKEASRTARLEGLVDGLLKWKKSLEKKASTSTSKKKEPAEQKPQKKRPVIIKEVPKPGKIIEQELKE